MTRKEEIINYANSFKGKGMESEELKEIIQLAVIDGAMWSDKNPDEKMIAKYLYEKKGYPIDLNGSLPSFDETMKDTEKYLKYKQDKFIEKACEWLQTNDSYSKPTELQVRDFRNYMKGE